MLTLAKDYPEFCFLVPSFFTVHLYEKHLQAELVRSSAVAPNNLKLGLIPASNVTMKVYLFIRRNWVIPAPDVL